MNIEEKKEILRSWILNLDEPFLDDLISEYIEGNDVFESKLSWTNLAGHVSERNNIVSYIRTRSGELFANGNDETAKEFRMLANQLQADGKADTIELDKYIKKSQRET